MLRPSLPILVLAGVALAAPARAHAPELPGPRPFDQMRGGCADFALDIRREAEVWVAGPVAALTAGAEPASAPVFAPGVLARTALVAHPDVRLDPPPEQDRGGPDRFSGHVRATIPAAGLWRVAASNGLWFDAVVEGRIVPSAAFEMQTGCTTPFKVVVFDLPAGELRLQLNGSPAPEVELLILPWAE